MFLTIIIVLVSIVTLLVVHEFGHFIVAKKFGVNVEEFGIGYPPKIFGKKIGETIYSLNLIPFGAFVKISGEGGEKSNIEDHRQFIGKPIWQRSLIIVGGVVSFWITAVILLTIVFTLGSPQAISDDDVSGLVNPRVQIMGVSTDSPADEAEIKTGDIIVEIKTIDSEIQIEKVIDVQRFTEDNKGKSFILTIQRGKEIFTTSLLPRVSPPKDEGAMGVSLVRVADKSYSLWQAPVEGVKATLRLTKTIILGWADIFSGLLKGNGMPKGIQFVGPIGIGNLLGQAAQVGVNYFLQFIAMVAVYLAIFNILPIPALDGGKLLFLIIEKIKGSPINRKIEQNITATFFIILIGLMVFLTIKDVIRLF